MAMFDSIFSGQAGVAGQLLDLFGTKAVYTKVINGDYDPITNTSLDTTISSNVLVSPPLRYKAQGLVNSPIQFGDCKIIGKGTDFTDVSNNIDTITINGILFTIIHHDRTYSGEQVASVTLYVREGVVIVEPVI